MASWTRLGDVCFARISVPFCIGILGWLAVACGGDDESSSSKGPSHDAAADAVDEPTSQPDASDASDAPGDVATDVVMDTDVADGPIGGVVLEEYEDVCAMLNGCFGIIGQGECMRRAYVYELASDEEQRYSFAMQSFVFGAGAPPGAIYFPEVIACAQTANDCDDIYACLGSGDACEVALTTPHCDNGVLYNCASTGAQGVTVETDCASHDLTCVSAPGGAPLICGESFCDPSSYVSNCVGDVAYNCVGAGLVAKDCAKILPGTKCLAVDVSGQQVAQCQGDGPACDDSFNPACTGVNLKVCQDGFEYERVCPQGLPCQVDPNTNHASCGALVTAGCAPETCEGTELTYCLDGLPRTLDCSGLGFSGCEADDFYHQARCVP